MCGITGILFRDHQRPVDEDTLRGMAGAIAHRGPDAEGLLVRPGVGLAHRRLSIIDLAGGDQPLGNEDGSVQVVFNGEIYNFRQLRHDLIAQGHRFRTKSDTEVLVHLYEEHADDLVHRLRGMFVFALWDERRQRLLLARDRVGIKPLYYCRTGETFLFGSEIKPLLVYPGLDRSLDLEALEDYLAYGVIPGERTIFKHIRKLLPGHVLGVTRDTLDASPRRYWRLESQVDDDLSVDEWLEAVRAKFFETVAAHRIADVPIGAFLSGGLDSSAVTTALIESGGTECHTFSIGFEEARFSELPYARTLAKRLGTQHHEQIVTPEAVSSLDDLSSYYDEPFADTSAIPTMAVSRLAREHVKVVLSGDGGDECFGGYRRYAHDLKEASVRNYLPPVLRRHLLRHVARMWPQADWLPRWARGKTVLTNLSLDAAAAYANTISICRMPLRRQLLHGDVCSQLNGHRPEDCVARGFGPHRRDPLRGMIAADIDMLLPDDFLTKVDRASMAVGLEVRPPLVDHEFLELSARIPSRLKIRQGQTKWLFKQLCDGWLPDDVVHRPKQGFEIPIDGWLRGPLSEVFRARVLDANTPVAGLLDQSHVQRLMNSHLHRTGNYGQILWSLLVLGCWMERYARNERRVARSEKKLEPRT